MKRHIVEEGARRQVVEVPENLSELPGTAPPGAHASTHASGGTDVLQHQALAGAGTNTHAQLDTHVAAAAPHSGHELTANKGTANGYASLDAGGKVPDAQIPAAIARDAEVTSAIATHEAAADPHAGYQRETEKAAASGYASLDAATKVPTAQLGGAGATALNYLRGDQVWFNPHNSEAWRYVGAGGQPAFENSWVNFEASETQYEQCKFYKDADGRVHLAGLIKNGTVSTGTTGTIFTLPAGYRPLKDIHIVAVANLLIACLFIDSSGRVRAHAGSNTWFSLGAISIRAEQ